MWVSLSMVNGCRLASLDYEWWLLGFLGMDLYLWWLWGGSWWLDCGLDFLGYEWWLLVFFRCESPLVVAVDMVVKIVI